MAAMPIRRNLQDQLLEMHAVVRTAHALELFAQNVFQAATDPGHEGPCRGSALAGRIQC